MIRSCLSFTMKKRAFDIDFLRGIAILVMIATHVYGLHLGNSFNFAIWNWSHFVVPGFLFCSGFVLSLSKTDLFTTPKHILMWIKKRALRLLVPYYIYFFLHFLLFLTFPQIFNNFHFSKNLDFILHSLTFSGGISVSWLPILFIELTLLFPILSYFKKKSLLVPFESIILVLIVLYTRNRFQIPYQSLTHWILWLFPFVLGILFSSLQEQVRKRAYLFGFLILLPIFLFLWQQSPDLILTHHKYPPDLYYLSYTLGLEFLILFASFYLLKISGLTKIIFFFSQNSYRIFFIHFIILDFVFSLSRDWTGVMGPIVQTLIVITFSGFTVVLWDIIKKRSVDFKGKLTYK